MPAALLRFGALALPPEALPVVLPPLLPQAARASASASPNGASANAVRRLCRMVIPSPPPSPIPQCTRAGTRQAALVYPVVSRESRVATTIPDRGGLTAGRGASGAAASWPDRVPDPPLPAICIQLPSFARRTILVRRWRLRHPPRGRATVSTSPSSTTASGQRSCAVT